MTPEELSNRLLRFAARIGKDKLPQWVNATIATTIVVVSAVLWALYAHTLTPNLIDDILLIAVYISVLIASPLKPLYATASPRLASWWRTSSPWAGYEMPEDTTPSSDVWTRETASIPSIPKSGEPPDVTVK